ALRHPDGLAVAEVPADCADRTAKCRCGEMVPRCWQIRDPRPRVSSGFIFVGRREGLMCGIKATHDVDGRTDRDGTACGSRFRQRGDARPAAGRDVETEAAR